MKAVFGASLLLETFNSHICCRKNVQKLFHCTKSVLNDSMGGRICHLGRLRLKAVIFFLILPF